MGSLKNFVGLCIYKIAIKKRNRYVFTSFCGHYSDNTKYISEKMHLMYPEIEIVWLVLPEHKKDVPDYVKVVDYDTLRAYWYRGSAVAQVDNNYGFRASFKFSNSFLKKIKRNLFIFFSNKKNQPIFATMHGTALKKIGRAQIGNNVLGFSCSNTYLIVGDRFTEESLRYITFNQCHMDTIGWPRNDILFSESNYEMKNRLGLPIDKKIVLFAPTFRNDGIDVEGKNLYRSGINQLSELKFDQLFDCLTKKFGGEWVMVCRFHYHVSELVDWEELETKYPNKFINGNKYDDMAQYLVCADILLTDSSSSMFDFAHTRKPCFLYFPDLSNYRDKERGFYYNIETLPFPIAENFETFLKNIEGFDLNEYIKNCEKMFQKLGSMDDGNASYRAVEYIMKKTCKKEKMKGKRNIC